MNQSESSGDATHDANPSEDTPNGESVADLPPEVSRRDVEATVHVSVMPKEAIEALDPQPGHTIVDGTLGGGGHTAMFAELIAPDGLIIALDRDLGAVEAAELRFADCPVKPVQSNFCDLPEVLAALGVEPVDGVLLDLGLSSDQLADQGRGFSFHSSGDLDLRFDVSRGEPAWRLINRLSEKHLADLIYEFGEERHSRRIARRVVERRQGTTIRSAKDFADIVRGAVPRDRNQRIDSATRTFQALRIAVNEELKSLDIALRRLPECVKVGGVVAIISFHSLEDRMVKNAFRENRGYEVVTRRPLRPSPGEVTNNPRSRSARLRVAKVIENA